MIRSLTARAVLVAFCLLPGAAAPAAADWKEARESLDERRMVGGDYAIFYSRSGPHAFPAGPALEAMAEQIDLALRVYGRDLGLIPPLDLPRYAEGVRIDVHVLDLGDRRGSAGDELHMFDYRAFGGEGPALTLAVSNAWRPPNRTPEHEVFHAYQYANTFFKNGWYLEGLARSMENLFRDGGWKNEPLPTDDAALDAVLGKSYGADRMWSRLALLCDPGCERGPRTPLTAGGVTGPPVCGRAIVGPLLQALDIADDAAGRDRGLSHTSWPEKEQRAPENTPYMLGALAGVVAAHCPVASDPELAAFHALITRRAEAGR